MISLEIMIKGTPERRYPGSSPRRSVFRSRPRPPPIVRWKGGCWALCSRSTEWRFGGGRRCGSRSSQRCCRHSTSRPGPAGCMSASPTCLSSSRSGSWRCVHRPGASTLSSGGCPPSRCPWLFSPIGGDRSRTFIARSRGGLGQSLSASGQCTAPGQGFLRRARAVAFPAREDAQER
jgi:hypothetical protein